MSKSSEYGEVHGYNPANLSCICGNTSDEDGFIHTNAYGVAIDNGCAKDDIGLAPWPDEGEKLHTLCPQCGRLYSDLPMVQGNSAPVTKLVDLSDPHIGIGMAVSRANGLEY